MGRPSKLPEVRDDIMLLAKSGNSIRIIGERVGVSESTMQRWLRWGGPDFDPASEECPADLAPYQQFWQDFREAQTAPVVMCEAAWITAAKDGNWQAAKSWLTMHRPDVYRESIDVQHGGRIEVAAERVTDALAEYQQVAERLANGD